MNNKINLTTRKKIVYLIGSLEVIGGAERQLVETAARLDRTKFDARIYAISEDGRLRDAAEKTGIVVRAYQTNCRGVFGYLKKFWALCLYLRQERPDIVHCFMFTPSLYGGFASRLMGRRTPLLITSRRSLGLFKDGNVLYQFLENVVNLFTDRVIVNSRAVLRDVLQRESIAAEKIEVIYNGIDTQHYRPSTDQDAQIFEIKARFGIPATAPVIGMIANLYRYKGHQEFVLALAEVMQRFPDARAICVGEDREGLLPTLQELCHTHGIGQHVVFAGFSFEIPVMLSMMDIVVLASHEEGFSNVILEAMAAGKPVVATSVGGNPEAVLDGETGRLVPAKNSRALAAAMQELLQSHEQRLACGRNGRQRVEEYFSMEQMISQTEQLYESLLVKCKK